MMNTLKLSVFKNKALFDAEKQQALPLCLAYLGLLLLRDPAGYIQWQPETLKAELFPYESLDMEKILLSLGELGLLEKMHQNGIAYALVLDETTQCQCC